MWNINLIPFPYDPQLKKWKVLMDYICFISKVAIYNLGSRTDICICAHRSDQVYSVCPNKNRKNVQFLRDADPFEFDMFHSMYSMVRDPYHMALPIYGIQERTHTFFLSFNNAFASVVPHL